MPDGTGEIVFEQINESIDSEGVYSADVVLKDKIEGFGINRFFKGFGGAVGDKLEVDYGSYNVVAMANSIDGVFTLNTPLKKHNLVQIDISNTGFKNTGLPHWVVEDNLEWVNSGLPSHLSQVYHSNVINFGISLERSNRGLQELNVPSHQALYVVPCNQEWYDIFNSTVDYNLEQDLGNRGLAIPYPNSIAEIDELDQVWVGGDGGVLAINTSDMSVERIDIDSRRSLFIKDIYKTSTSVLVLDESKLYEYDINAGSITKDKGLGLPGKMYKIILMFDSVFVVGGEDGIYVRRRTQEEWQKVVSTLAPVEVLISPDASFAVANNQVWYSTDGFTWTKLGEVTGKNVNELVKHRSQILVATDKGLYGDNGSFYANNVSLALINFLGDADDSAEVIINDVDSNFTTAVATISDGRYMVWDNSGYLIVTEEDFSSIHKVAFVSGGIWIFSYGQFKIRGETTIRRLATGKRI